MMCTPHLGSDSYAFGTFEPLYGGTHDVYPFAPSTYPAACNRRSRGATMDTRAYERSRPVPRLRARHGVGPDNPPPDAFTTRYHSHLNLGVNLIQAPARLALLEMDSAENDLLYSLVESRRCRSR
jgi:hypothetical protein